MYIGRYNTVFKKNDGLRGREILKLRLCEVVFYDIQKRRETTCKWVCSKSRNFGEFLVKEEISNFGCGMG